MKTLHRAAYEVLTPEEYKEFCRIPKELFEDEPNSLLVDWTLHEHRVIIDSFSWASAPKIDGVESSTDYWDRVDDRLRLGVNHA